MKKNRSTLKDYFRKGDIPTESNFADLIDSMVNQEEDCIDKLPNDPLGITAVGTDESLINFYRMQQNQKKLSWQIKQKPGGKSGLSVNDTVANRLFIEDGTGNVGIGTTSPTEKLEVSGKIKISGTNNELFFQDNGQIRSYDDNHRIMFRRPENILELREFGKIVFSPGASTGAETAKVTFASSGNVGIGTASPTEKLEVSGNAKIAGGQIQLDGGQKITFTDIDISNNLKLQLRTGHGLGINNNTLFYAANGQHSWRDANGTNERMLLTTGANGGLVVKGTGNSSFAGSLGIGTATPTAKLDVNGDIMASDGIDHSMKTIGQLQNNLTLRSGIYQNNGDGLGNAAGTKALNDWWHVINMHHQHNNGYNAQIAVPLNATPNEIFFRTSRLGTWTEWRKVLSENSSGNIGIGTSTPDSKLHIVGGDNAVIIENNENKAGNNEADIRFVVNSHNQTQNWQVGTNEEAQGWFVYDNEYRLVVKQGTGNVGIGTLNPNYKLEVGGDISVGRSISAPATGGGARLYFNGAADNTDPLWMARYNAGDNITYLQINLGNNSSQDRLQVGYTDSQWNTSFFIDSSGLYSSSDMRLKENIDAIPDALQTIKQIRGVQFHWKREHKKGVSRTAKSFGVLAQEVEAVVPNAVSTDQTGVKFVNYNNLIPLLIESIKSQQTQIEELQAEIKQLKLAIGKKKS